MKVRSTTFIASLVLLMLSTFWVSCTDEEEIRPKTISDIIQQDNRFTILRAVLRQGGMSDALRTGSYTFFAPNDDGFRKMSITEPSQVSRMTRDSLRSIIQYLVLDGIHESADFEVGTKYQVRAFDNNNLFITKDNTRFMVNMAQVIEMDLRADNGIVHVLDHVPSTSPFAIAEWISANPSFSFLAAMANRVIAVNPDVAMQLLSENSSFTLFAPSNEAFMNSGFSSLEEINTADPAILISLLTAHILPNAYFTTEFKTGQMGTIGNQPLLIAVNGTITVGADQNTDPLPTIVRSDILTKNGVIHVLDRVLLP